MQTSLFEEIQPVELRQPALRQADVTCRVRFGSYVTVDVAKMAYADFIDWVQRTTNAKDMFFGYYMDGEPFCSGSFGEIRYSAWLRHGR